MTYGLEAGIQDRVEAYRGQPEALVQKYQVSQQLLDLLALQKLKSDQEAAARQLALSTATPAGTIAQQREQELLQMTRAQIGQDPASSGIAAQLPPGALQMAGGGIVGFNKGGYTGEVPAGEMAPIDDAGLEMLMGALRRTTMASAAERILRTASNPKKALEAMFRALSPAELPAPAASAPEAPMPSADAPPSAPADIPQADVDAALAAMSPLPVQRPAAPSQPAMAQPSVSEDPALREMLQSRMQPGDVYGDTQQQFRESLGLGELMKQREEARAAQQARFAAENDPEKLRKERLRAFMLAAAGGSGIASGLRMGSQYMGDTERFQQERGAEFEAAQLADIDKQIQDAIGIGTTAAQIGVQREGHANTMANAATQGTIELLRQERAALEGSADRASREKIAELDRTARLMVESNRIQIELAKMGNAGLDPEFLAREAAKIASEVAADPRIAIIADPAQRAAAQERAIQERLVSLRSALGQVSSGMGATETIPSAVEYREIPE